MRAVVVQCSIRAVLGLLAHATILLSVAVASNADSLSNRGMQSGAGNTMVHITQFIPAMWSPVYSLQLVNRSIGQPLTRFPNAYDQIYAQSIAGSLPAYPKATGFVWWLNSVTGVTHSTSCQKSFSGKWSSSIYSRKGPNIEEVLYMEGGILARPAGGLVWKRNGPAREVSHFSIIAPLFS